MSVKYWQDVLPDVLYSIRSLLCTATNETPHERFFRFPRRSSSGYSIPTWITTPGPVLLNCQVRSSKTDPLVDEAELLLANPHYAYIHYPDGQETTVSVKHLAPKGQPMTPTVRAEPGEPTLEIRNSAPKSETEALFPHHSQNVQQEHQQERNHWITVLLVSNLHYDGQSGPVVQWTDLIFEEGVNVILS